MESPEETYGTEPGDQVIRQITPPSEHFLHNVAGDRQHQHIAEQVAPTDVHEHRSQPRDRLGLVDAEHETLGHQAGSYFVQACTLAVPRRVLRHLGTDDASGAQFAHEDFIVLHQRIGEFLPMHVSGCSCEPPGVVTALLFEEVLRVTRQFDVGQLGSTVKIAGALHDAVIADLESREYQHVDQDQQQRDDGRMTPIRFLEKGDQKHGRLGSQS